MKTFFQLAVFTFCTLFSNAQPAFPFPGNLIVENISLNSGTINYTHPADIISPSIVTKPVAITSNAKVTYQAGNEIILKDGFTASGFSNTGYYIGKIQPFLLITPNPNTSIVNGLVHVPKWEKLELGFTLPQEYTNAVNKFFIDYYGNLPVNPSPLPTDITDLNPYADDSLKVKIDLVSPTGTQITKWAFFMRMATWQTDGVYTAEQTLVQDIQNPLNDFNWRFRFAPNEVNTTIPWNFTITISGPSGATQFPTYTYSGFQFICDNPLPDNKGYLNVNANGNGFLQFDNGDGFFGVGNNISDHRHCGSNTAAGYPCLYNNTYNYVYFKDDFDNIINTLDKMSNVGANYVRMWLNHYDFAPEFDNLGVYDQYVSIGTCDIPNTIFPSGNHQYQLWTLDQVFDKLREKNIYAQIVYEPFPAGAPYEIFLWGDNAYAHHFIHDYESSLPPPPPYKSYTVEEAYTNNTFYWWKRRMKYIMARYDYSVNLAAIETINEVDQLLGYQCNNDPLPWGGDARCNSHKNLLWPYNTILHQQLEDWHSALLSYVRESVALGGLGINKHLLEISYTSAGLGYKNASTTSVGTCAAVPVDLAGYHHLFNTPGTDYIDLLDIHVYDPNKWNDKVKWDIANGDITGGVAPTNIRMAFNNKPFHVGEGHNVWYVNNGDVANIFNNYDISFHNEIWSSTFMGHFTTSLTYEYSTLFRWPNGAPVPPAPLNTINDLGELFSFAPLNINFEPIASYYHNFYPLSSFINANQIDFNSGFTKKIFYDDQVQNIECFYMLNGQNAYGWIHNINAYLGNRFIYSAVGNNYNYGCTGPSPAPSGINLTGFNSNTTYQFDFYYTRMGTPPVNFPTSQTYTSDATGKITLSASLLAYLGCDSTNADFAFSASDQHSLLRTAQHTNQIEAEDSLSTEKQKIVKKQEYNFTVKVYPNPGTGMFELLMFGVDEKSAEVNLVVKDLTGRKIHSENLKNKLQTFISLGYLAKGNYYLELKNNNKIVTKKIVIL